MTSRTSASPHGPLLALSANSVVPVAVAWSSATQIIGGIAPVSIRCHIRDNCWPPSLCPTPNPPAV